jgi:hypothetical protein
MVLGALRAELAFDLAKPLGLERFVICVSEKEWRSSGSSWKVEHLKRKGRLLDGQVWNEYPVELQEARVRAPRGTRQS